MSRRHRSSLLLGFLLSPVVAAPVAAAPVGIARSAGGALPLPACRYDDVRTRYDRPPRWRKSLLDTIYKLPRSYEPGSLASTLRAGLNGGATIDFRSASSTRAPWDYDDRATTAPGRWMKRNAWRYGFLMSYPKGKRSESCYSYEPWHYRSMGRDTAAAGRERRVTLRRYLWETWETAPS